MKRGVSCRPGQLGVPSEFVFCPAPGSQGCGNSNRQEIMLWIFAEIVALIHPHKTLAKYSPLCTGWPAAAVGHQTGLALDFCSLGHQAVMRWGERARWWYINWTSGIRVSEIRVFNKRHSSDHRLPGPRSGSSPIPGWGPSGSSWLHWTTLTLYEIKSLAFC